MTESRSDARAGLGTVRNAVLLLELLAEGPSYQQLTDLAERSGLSLPTAHRLLRSLALADVVTQDPRSSRYSLGPELARLSHRYLARLPVLGALQPYLVDLRDTLATTVEVQALVRESVVAVDQVDGSDMGAYRRAHAVAPPLESAGGRLLASRAEDERWERILAAAAPDLQDLARSQRKAWAQAPWLAVESHDPARPGEVAVPLLPLTGAPEAALVALLPADGRAPEDVAAHLMRAAQAAMRSVSHG